MQCYGNRMETGIKGRPAHTYRLGLLEKDTGLCTQELRTAIAVQNELAASCPWVRVNRSATD